MRKIVLTGGPGAGKTTIARSLLRDYPGCFVVVPEAATQVFHQLQTTWRTLTLAGRRDLQHRIYRLQRQQEEAAEQAHPTQTLLLDRGTVDGAAYWPDGMDDFWPNMQTDLATELARYDAVICLETCAVLDLYDGTDSNPTRHEDRPGAVACDRRLLFLWQHHPRVTPVPACPSMGDKYRAVQCILRQLGVLAGQPPIPS